MTTEDLRAIYRDYIACLNSQDWPNLGRFVDDAVIHNDRPFGLAGYRAMLEENFADIPDLYFDVRMLLCDPPHVVSRIWFDCTPKGSFLGLAVNGRKVTFAENVIYQFHDGKIVQVWSIVDKAAIEAQLQGH
ncbi:ester cyclase [Geminicoccus flavidas]|uniref:ester cyclase n=1 Tax=Geminicoccus flavidas TaxID=2506407 RepID=UPI001356C295|nr:ester cyclase [Geminicoccus flavidas]